MGLSISSKSVPFYMDLEDFHRISSKSCISNPHLGENKKNYKDDFIIENPSQGAWLGFLLVDFQVSHQEQPYSRP